MRVGVMATEWFDPSVGRVGGFGFAARQTARVTREGRGDETVFLTGWIRQHDGRTAAPLHDTRIVYRAPTVVGTVRLWRRQRLDLLLTIDWAHRFLPTLAVMPRTPLLWWARDPRSSQLWEEIRTLRLPGGPPSRDLEIGSPARSEDLRALVKGSRITGRRLRVAVVSPFLVDRFEAAYGTVPGGIAVLGNAIDMPAIEMEDRRSLGSRRPLVVFLGRADPIKRPWIFIELARRHPDWRFVLAGSLDNGGKYDVVSRCPENLLLTEHLDGEDKDRLLREARCIVNTSVYEGLPVSFCEALSYHVPVVAMVDPEAVPSRFGRYVGKFLGDGLDGLAALDDAVSEIVEDSAQALELGSLGRRWTEEHHSRERFLHTYARLVSDLLGPKHRVATAVGVELDGPP